MQRTTNPVWRRWELDPPVFTVDEVNRVHKTQLGPFQRLGLLRQTTPAVTRECSDCAVNHEVIYRNDVHGHRHGFIVCETCGIQKLPPDQLDQVIFDTARTLTHLFADVRISVQPIATERLWHIGRRAFHGTSRELILIRGSVGKHDDAIRDHLATRPKAIVFTSTRMVASYWTEQLSNTVISIEEVASITNDAITLEWDAVDDMILDSQLTEPPSKPKRSSRATKIEALRKELKQHLASAYEHAMRTSEESGYPELLPRPTQSQLARATNMTPSDVSRCLKDKQADELRLLWSTAINIEAILRLRRGHPMMK